MNKVEFTFLGLNMEGISVIYGIFLITWGFGVTFLSESTSTTSLIPSILGAPILILSILAIWMPERKKLLMHISVTFGLLIFLGGIDFLRGFLGSSDPFENAWAGSSKLMMLITGLVYCFLCIQSFRFARINREKSNS
jgi:hypothetical protein|tara:strand:+ start:3114 stop:3527 length:414 start_codon:yes stop_codon:yes gene_type:complete